MKTFEKFIMTTAFGKELKGQHVTWISPETGYLYHGFFIRKTLFGNYLFTNLSGEITKLNQKNIKIDWLPECLTPSKRK